MKKILFIAAAFIVVLQAPAFAAEKIGVFSMQKVMLECDYGKVVADKLKAKFEPMEKEIQREAESIKKLESNLKTQDLALKLEAKQDMQRDYRRKMRDYQDSVVAYRQKRQAEQQRLGQPIAVKVAKVVDQYGKANGYTIIFETQATGIAFIADGVNISDAIITELNKMKKSGK